MKPTRCCVQTLKGTRCANEPSPVRSTRMIGPVEIAACGLDGHQRAMRGLPDFVRHDAYCGAVGCDQASNAGICKKHRDMYRDFGITEHMLLAQEAPMTEPAPAAPPVTPYDVLDATAKVWFAMPQEERDARLVAISVATISTGDSAPTPPAAPQDAAGDGAPLPPIFQPLDPGIAPVVDLLRAEGLSTTDSGDGYSKKEAIEAGEALDYAHVFIQVPEGERVEDIIANAKAIPWADYGYQVPTVELLERAPESAADEPEIVAVHWPVGQLHTPKPPAKVTKAEFEPLHPLEARRASLIARLYMAGFAKVDGPAEYLWRFNGPNGAVLIPVGHPCEVERDFADMLDHAEKECAKVEAAAMPADAVEPSVGDVDDAPLFVGATDPMQQRREAVAARLLALGFAEHDGTDTLRMFLGHGWFVPIPLPGHDTEPRKAEDMIDDAERLCRRMEKKAEPTAPGPTLAEVQAELKEATRLSECRRKEVQRRGDALARMEVLLKEAEADAERERKRANEADGLRIHAETDLIRERERADAAQTQLREALADLATIAAMLDPEDSPAYDSDDQPIPLPMRVQTALMPRPVDPDRESELCAMTRSLSKQLSDVDDVLHWLGSYGNVPTVDRLMKVLTPEDRRNIWEFRAADARADIARLKARRLVPPPPGRLEKYAADLAKAEAALGALPSLPPSTTPLTDELRDLVARIRCECPGEEAAAVCAELLTVAETLARMEAQ